MESTAVVFFLEKNQYFFKQEYCSMESTAVVFFLEKNQYFLLSRTLFRQGATAPKSWQVPPVITGGLGEDTQIKSYYSRRKTRR